MLRKLRLQGAKFGAKGELIPIEIIGPPTYVLWSKSYSVLRTCVISHRAVPLGGVKLYWKVISNYRDRYGKENWHVYIIPMFG